MCVGGEGELTGDYMPVLSLCSCFVAVFLKNETFLLGTHNYSGL